VRVGRFLLFIVFISSIYAAPLRYAPLSLEKSEIVLHQSEEFLKYLTKVTQRDFEIVFNASYDKIIDDFKKRRIDIAYLGPLPYVKLKNEYPHVKPLVSFKEKSGESSYTCLIFTSKDSKIKTLQDVKSKKIALTQKLSTCGYLMSEDLLRQQNLSLKKDLNYFYSDSHSNAILSVLTDEADVGSCKNGILDKYSHFGFTVLAETKPLPGFILAVNTETVTPEVYQKIKEALLKLDPINNIEDDLITKEWGVNLRYGCSDVSEDDFNVIEDAVERVGEYE